MRRLNLVLLASLRLCGARTHGFSIHSDLLAFPQYEVVFSDEPIAEKEAQDLLEKHAHPTQSATPGATPNDGSSSPRDDDDDEANAKTYELMNMAQQKYLCSIPILPPEAAENKTATALAQAEEERDLARAAADGWNLLSDLESTCLYFTAGWWTYSFCKNTEIVQYHALPAVKADQPPQMDPRTMAFVLGREPALPEGAKKKSKAGGDMKDRQQQQQQQQQHPAELQTTEDQRYLVQKLERGDVCDLTGRERTIEVRYECMPEAKGDKIGYIKEVAICAYMMVIHTPKLCKDVAFLPREEPKAHPITCQLVLGDGDEAAAAKVAEIGATAAKVGEGLENAVQGQQGQGQAKGAGPISIGGTVVGGRKFLSAGDVAGQPPTRLSFPKDQLNDGQGKRKKTNTLPDQKTTLIAQRSPPSEGGKLNPYPTEAEIEAMEIPWETYHEMEIELDKLAAPGKKGWRIEAIRQNGRIEIVGSLYPTDEDEGEGGKAHDKAMVRELEDLMRFRDEIDAALREWNGGEEKKKKEGQKVKGEKEEGDWDRDQYDDEEDHVQKKDGEDGGSEERFKDEL